MLPRDEVRAYFAELFDGKLEKENPGLWGSLVSLVTDLYPEELYDRIKRAYEEDCVDEMYIGLDDIEEELNKDKDACLQRARTNPHHQLIESAIQEMEWWAWYKEPLKPLPRPANPPLASAQTYVAPPKVGRNDPCSCGSGKKYKKCCGK